MKPITEQFKNSTADRYEAIALTYHPYIGRVASTMAIICALSIFLYGIFLLEAVAQAASRTTAERQINQLSSQLGVLEGQYLASTKSLTPDRARALGFVEPKEVSTVVIAQPGTLSFVGR